MIGHVGFFNNIDTNKLKNTGSYRLNFIEMNNHLLNKGVSSYIFSDFKLLKDNTSVIILYKGLGSLAKYIKNLNPKILVGIINPDSINDDFNNCDFAIVNSIEEKVSLKKFYNNIFIFNLIEDSYYNEPLKFHEPTKNLSIGYHGHSSHIDRMNYGFLEAINALVNEKEIKYSLKICTENNQLSKKLIQSYKKLNFEIDFIEWSINNIKSMMHQIDIGYVPNMHFNKIKKRNVDTTNGFFESDYSVRFKNKSNPGRAFVFIQFGIPIITDLTPSMLPIYHDETTGLICSDYISLYKGIKTMSNNSVRNEMSRNAFLRFKNIYSRSNDMDLIIDFFNKSMK